jgi:hypothetical protein
MYTGGNNMGGRGKIKGKLKKKWQDSIIAKGKKYRQKGVSKWISACRGQGKI